MKNLVMIVLGIFGYGEEFVDFIDIMWIGGIIVKGIIFYKCEGNLYFCMVEIFFGMLNVVGL